MRAHCCETRVVLGLSEEGVAGLAVGERSVQAHVERTDAQEQAAKLRDQERCGAREDRYGAVLGRRVRRAVAGGCLVLMTRAGRPLVLMMV
eukprot:1898834-Rhodomonas_salina.2